MTPRFVDYYERYHARFDYFVEAQKVPVSRAAADQIIANAQGAGPGDEDDLRAGRRRRAAAGAAVPGRAEEHLPGGAARGLRRTARASRRATSANRTSARTAPGSRVTVLEADRRRRQSEDATMSAPPSGPERAEAGGPPADVVDPARPGAAGRGRAGVARRHGGRLRRPRLRPADRALRRAEHPAGGAARHLGRARRAADAADGAADARPAPALAAGLPAPPLAGALELRVAGPPHRAAAASASRR